MTRHHLFDPDGMPPAVGFSYGAMPAPGRTLFLAGLTGHHEDGNIDDNLVGQFARACEAVARVIAEAGGDPTDLVSMTIYTTDVAAYRSLLTPLGVQYRNTFGDHYPPMALIGVGELFDPRALVELVGVAVVPDQVSRRG
jgi:enamine deaminase RidA (YjgF/YER057c/UK114 family)